MVQGVRILQLGKFYPIRGGVEKVMYDLVRGLDAHGVHCDMLCAAESGPTVERPLGAKAKIICTRTMRKLYATMLSPSMVSNLRRRVNDYDMVAIHHPDPMACLALRLSGYKGKVVLHWHSDIVGQRRLLQAYRPLQRWLLRRADVIVGTTPSYLAASPWLKRYQEKTAVLPIGIEPMEADEALTAAVAARYPGRKIVFSLGRLVPYKGFEHLIKAACSLPADYVVVIGGEGPLHDKLQAQIDALGLRDRVVLTGALSDAEVAAHFHACTLFCLPSVFKSEAFGIVQLEAMSAAKPIVATQIPGSGVSWVNLHGVTGLNVPVADHEALARAIVEITASPATLRRYSEAALERYRSEFTRDLMISRACDIYSHVLAGNSLTDRKSIEL